MCNPNANLGRSVTFKALMHFNQLSNMDIYDTIYAVLTANDGKINGRTVIQKIIYLASKKISQLDVPPYKAHYYGPFSPGLGWALETMTSYSFLYEARTPGATYEGYTYGLTADGQKIASRAKNNYKNIFENIRKIVEICKDFCELKTAPLSYASKIHYMANSNMFRNGMSFSDAVEHARKLGWNVSKDDVEQGARLLERLNLGKVS